MTKQVILKPTLRRICLTLADQIVTNSNRSLDTFLAGRKRRSERDLVHYLGIDPAPLIAAKPDRAAFRRRHGFAEDARIVLFAGRMVPEKNPVFAVDVIAEMRRSDPLVVGMFAGAGSLEAEVRARAAARGVEPFVRLLGWRDDIAEVMAASDWFILPHPGESTGRLRHCGRRGATGRAAIAAVPGSCRRSTVAERLCSSPVAATERRGVGSGGMGVVVCARAIARDDTVRVSTVADGDGLCVARTNVLAWSTVVSLVTKKLHCFRVFLFNHRFPAIARWEFHFQKLRIRFFLSGQVPGLRGVMRPGASLYILFLAPKRSMKKWSMIGSGHMKSLCFRVVIDSVAPGPHGLDANPSARHRGCRKFMGVGARIARSAAVHGRHGNSSLHASRTTAELDSTGGKSERFSITFMSWTKNRDCSGSGPRSGCCGPVSSLSLT